MSKSYGRRRVLSRVNLRVSAGDRILLAGANGSGKTTLLRILATTLRPSAGRLVWEDTARKTTPEQVRARVGYAAHQPLVYDELTAWENLRFVARMHGVQETEPIERWLDAFGLAGRGQDRAATLSRGLRQRLALARAFVTRPRLLLLDEPSTSLDADALQALRHALDRLEPEVALVMTAHEPGALEAIATRRLRLEAGELREAGGT